MLQFLTGRSGRCARKLQINRLAQKTRRCRACRGHQSARGVGHHQSHLVTIPGQTAQEIRKVTALYNQVLLSGCLRIVKIPNGERAIGLRIA